MGVHQRKLIWKTLKERNNNNNNNNNNNDNNNNNGNLKRETESLLIAAQNNIRTNHIKARLDKTQQNSKCMLCGDRDKTINHIISECSKLARKEYKTRNDWVGKIIYWELCKKLKFDHYEQLVYAQSSICPGETSANSSEILRYKRIIWSQPDDRTLT